ncbi:MAG: hypothetical protein IJ217_00285 [Clostridia bacterium]|nr:hypothetical protein [Clostridia bacterium]
MKKIFTFFMVLMMVSCMFITAYATEDTAQTERVTSNASETVLSNVTGRQEKIAEYTEKYGGDAVYGKTAYYLSLAQKYSIPICFIGLAIGALNFFIIGNKKLEKREQGFGMIIAFLLGLVVFQVLPLLFAIVVAGR